MLIVKLVKRFGGIKYMSGNPCRIEILDGTLNFGGKLNQSLEQLYFFRVAQQSKIRVRKWLGSALGFCQNTADPGVSILAVGTGKSIK